MSYQYQTRISFGPPMTPMTRMFLFLNIGAYVLLTIDRTAGWHYMDLWLSLIPVVVIQGFQVWRLVTYMFIHGPLIHILFNMFILWMFGPEIERVLGSSRFVKYYFFTGVGAGLCSLVVTPNSTALIMGASGVMYALLLAYAIYFPNRELLLFFILPIKAKYLVIGLVLFEVFLTVGGPQDHVAHFAHVGGALFGYIFLKRRTILPDFKYYYLRLKGWWYRRKFKVYTSDDDRRGGRRPH